MGNITATSAGLAGRTVWITGAGRGLGRALALGFGAAGAELMLFGRSSDSLRDTADELESIGVVAHVTAGSVTDSEAVAAAAELAREMWGGLDVLVNNAGISPSFRRSESVDPAEVQSVLDVNVIGALRCCQAAAGLMEARGGGAIVNVSSVHGTVAHERLLAYAVSKAGLELLTRTLAIEWAPRRIRVNALAPGYLVTDMTAGLRESAHWRDALTSRIPLGRFGEPSEMVGAATFLASDAASYVTGATLLADGGWTAQ